MSRTVRDQEKKVFDTLQNYIPQETVGRINNVKRSLFFSQLTYAVIERANLYYSNTIFEYRIALIRYENNNYICIHEDLFKRGVLSFEYEVDNKELLYGIGVLLFNEGILKPKSQFKGFPIYDIFFGHIEDKEYKCGDIFEVVEDFLVFEITEEDFIVKYSEDLDRILYMLCFSSLLKESELSFNMFELLELESSRCILSMIENILQTQNEDLIFLQLYRCIEYLFIIHKALAYSDKYELQLENVLKMLNTEKIRFPENSNIQAIVSEYCSDVIVNEYYTYIMRSLMLQESDKVTLKDKVANYIYETRCKIAHFKYGQEKIKDKETLGESNIILSKVVKNIYQQLDDKLVEINEKMEVWHKIILK